MSEFDTESQDDLDDFFAAAKQNAHAVPQGLIERMLIDADQIQESFQTEMLDQSPAPGLVRGFRDMLGGWPAIGGLITACATGIWLGFAPPAALPDPFEMAGLMQDDLDMFDADSLTAGWIENTSSPQIRIAE